jgi:hypothetical protein
VILRMASLVPYCPHPNKHSKASTKINAAVTVFLPAYRLDARTNDEMRAECHLIVKSLSSFRKPSGSVTASWAAEHRGKYFRAYHWSD